jgi:hypothetical protein
MKQGKGNTVKHFQEKKEKNYKKKRNKKGKQKNEVCLLSLNFKLASKQTKIQNFKKPLYFYCTKYLKK